jgi:para-nitrobenzyl esterase
VIDWHLGLKIDMPSSLPDECIMSDENQSGDAGVETVETVETDESVEGAGPRRGILIAAAVLLAMIAAAGIAVGRWVPSAAGREIQIADVSSERLLGFGSVVGFADANETHAWLGIPYARPPLGEWRWRAPAPPEAWGDTLDALEVLSACPQLTSELGGVQTDDPTGIAGSEDCLGLNIWSPRMEADSVPRGRDRLPVMVWIHGGGNTIGHGGSTMYDGARLSGSQNVVVVTFNYRLGPFGWFSHEALREASSSRAEASGNFAILDQIRALEWVRENISEFGGDPNNVTIFGESAGATNVLALLLSKPAARLFHRAIAQSGSTDSMSRAEAENAVDADVPGHARSSAEIVARLLVRAGIVPDRASALRYAAELAGADLLTFLRDRSPSEVLDVVRKPGAEMTIDVPKVIRDGFVLPDSNWLEAFREGRFNAVPTLLGSNRDEMKLFHSQRGEYVRKRFKVLYRIRDAEAYERRARYASDLWKARAVDRPATAIADSRKASVFGYRFDWDEEPSILGMDLAALLGASHGFEIPFVFGNFDLGDPLYNSVLFNDDNLAAREALSERMMGYWAEFARTGSPGRGGRDDAPKWPEWTGDGSEGDVPDDRGPALGRARMLVFDTESDAGIRVTSTRMSRDHVIAAVESETSLEPSEKCALFLDLFGERPDWDVSEFRRLGQGGCADFPVD